MCGQRLGTDRNHRRQKGPAVTNVERSADLGDRMAADPCRPPVGAVPAGEHQWSEHTVIPPLVSPWCVCVCVQHRLTELMQAVRMSCPCVVRFYVYMYSYSLSSSSMPVSNPTGTHTLVHEPRLPWTMSCSCSCSWSAAHRSTIGHMVHRPHSVLLLGAQCHDAVSVACALSSRC